MTDLPHHELLTQYLLGSLSVEEAERLDELSVTDDDFAAQLNAAENDLVDSYVRGELSGNALAQFKSVYLSSPKRREKLALAETLLAFEQRRAAPRLGARAASPQKAGTQKRWSFSPGAWLVPQRGLAIAAVLLFVASGYLFTANRQLRQQLDSSNAERGSLVQQEQDLQHELAARPPASQGTESAATGLGEKTVDQLRVATFIFAPSLRGAGPLPVVPTPPDTDLVVLKLELESNDFPKYLASLEDSSTRQTVWRSPELTPVSDGDKRAVSFAFHANLLKNQNYMIQLRGVRSNSALELVSTYPFKAVVK
ncbi:MAG TPA: hypothetical protein VMG31_00930 [Verrucomicrobiae bacterium]|nr:hypothetical protein [Verrucomicrobiae bacterium]